jgi:hypothetical protein
MAAEMRGVQISGVDLSGKRRSVGRLSTSETTSGMVAASPETGNFFYSPWRERSTSIAADMVIGVSFKTGPLSD